ncbi:MAG: protein kinase, partial [Planctomycetota bacterium]
MADRKFLARGTGPVGATTLGRAQARSYAVPAIALVVVLAVGWWAVTTLESTLQHEVESTLTTILEADVAAIRIWLQQQTSGMEALAIDEFVRAEAEELVRMREVDNATTEQLLAAPQQARIRALTEAYMKVFGYVGFGVFDGRGRVVAAGRDLAVGMTGKAIVGEAFKATPEKPYILPPFVAPEGSSLPTTRTTMAIVGPLRDVDGNIYGTIGFRIEPSEFTKLLTIARMGESGETYAFNRAGLMISESRFEDQLRQLGLIESGETSILNISIRNPGVDLTTGAKPKRDPDQQPLTLMAADAVAGGTGMNVDGYRDYRGVEVLGAWTWLKEYEFGVTTEIDKTEAYAALGIMRLAVWILIGLLVLGAGTTFFVSMLIYRLRRKVNVAQQLGSYTLEGKIGEGAMGEVYRASHSMLRRPTAIKMLRAEHASGERMARFEREVQLTSRLMHHNTVAIYDYGSTPEGTFYYAMEY